MIGRIGKIHGRTDYKDGCKVGIDYGRTDQQGLWQEECKGGIIDKWIRKTPGRTDVKVG